MEHLKNDSAISISTTGVVDKEGSNGEIVRIDPVDATASGAQVAAAASTKPSTTMPEATAAPVAVPAPAGANGTAAQAAPVSLFGSAAPSPLKRKAEEPADEPETERTGTSEGMEAREDRDKTPVPEPRPETVESPSATTPTPKTNGNTRDLVHQPTLPPPNLRPQSILFANESFQNYNPLPNLDALAGSSSAPGAPFRPYSILSEPLHHPNGREMFPDLTTAQQEEIAWEASTQVEGSITADSDEVASTVNLGDLTDDEGQGDNDQDDIVSDAGVDGGYESDQRSSASTSVESTVRDFMFENGRRYHRYREGRYNFPNDDVEQEREDMKHACVKLLCSQKLHFAPIGSNPQQILDIGTGTGIWAIEMADQYPSAQVLGVDLSPIQPDWVPPNARFMVDDIESAWLYPRNHFDYIHSRHTVMAIKDWMRLSRRAYEHLKPGGWIELQEVHHLPISADNSLPPNHPVVQYWSNINDGLEALGINFHAAAGGRLANQLRDAGFVNVTERILHLPIGTWPKNKVLKQVGVYWRTILLDGIQAISLGPMTRGLRWTREQVELFLVEVRRAYYDNSHLMYMPMHIVYGQKPLHSY